MAHASRSEVMKNQLEKIHKARSKEKARIAAMDLEERTRIDKARCAPVYANRVAADMWDIAHHQCPAFRYKLVLENCANRIIELEAQEDTVFKYEEIEKVKNFKEKVEQLCEN